MAYDAAGWLHELRSQTSSGAIPLKGRSKTKDAQSIETVAAYHAEEIRRHLRPMSERILTAETKTAMSDELWELIVNALEDKTRHAARLSTRAEGLTPFLSLRSSQQSEVVRILTADFVSLVPRFGVPSTHRQMTAIPVLYMGPIDFDRLRRSRPQLSLGETRQFARKNPVNTLQAIDDGLEALQQLRGYDVAESRLRKFVFGHPTDPHESLRSARRTAKRLVETLNDPEGQPEETFTYGQAMRLALESADPMKSARRALGVLPRVMEAGDLTRSDALFVALQNAKDPVESARERRKAALKILETFGDNFSYSEAKKITLFNPQKPLEAATETLRLALELSRLDPSLSYWDAREKALHAPTATAAALEADELQFSVVPATTTPRPERASSGGSDMGL